MRVINIKVKIPDKRYKVLDKMSQEALKKALEQFTKSWFLWWLTNYEK